MTSNSGTRWALGCLHYGLLAHAVVQAQSPRDNLVDSVQAKGFAIKAPGVPFNGDWILNRSGYIQNHKLIVPTSALKASATPRR